MLTRTSHAPHTMRQTLEPVCAQQEFAELRWGSAAECAPLRVRFIRVKGDELHLQVTPSVDSAKAPSEGQNVTIHAVLEGQQCRLATRVRKVLISVGPGARPRAASLILSLPEQLSRQQRRSAFRIPLTGQGGIQVSVCPAAAERSDCCPTNARPLRGQMVNLSTGGLCTIVRIDRIGEVRVGQRLFVEFGLPEVDQAFVVLGEVRNVRAVHQGGGVLVGIRFLSGLTWSVESLMELITQFVTREERRRLRRKR